MNIYNFIRKGILVEFILIVILILYFQRQPSLETLSPDIINPFIDWQEYPISDIALINTYLDDIQNATAAFYSDKYYQTPTVAWYFVTVKSVIAKDNDSLNPIILITFENTPYLGAHNTVGYDEITFQASYTGEVMLLEYKQLKSYDLPDHLKDLKKIN